MKKYSDFLAKGGERKWQQEWDRQKLYHADDTPGKPKHYVLVEFPYPSGEGLLTVVARPLQP